MQCWRGSNRKYCLLGSSETELERWTDGWTGIQMQAEKEREKQRKGIEREKVPGIERSMRKINQEYSQFEFSLQIFLKGFH